MSLTPAVEVAIATPTQQGADFQLVLTGDFDVNTQAGQTAFSSSSL